MSAGLHFAYK